jgi:formylglycine-generating enzyme required for sulfatase activity
MDMSGNVWEWTLTEYGSKRSGDLASHAMRVLRGGAWSLVQTHAQAASRGDRYPDFRYSSIGFRLASPAKSPKL